MCASVKAPICFFFLSLRRYKYSCIRWCVSCVVRVYCTLGWDSLWDIWHFLQPSFCLINNLQDWQSYVEILLSKGVQMLVIFCISCAALSGRLTWEHPVLCIFLNGANISNTCFSNVYRQCVDGYLFWKKRMSFA